MVREDDDDALAKARQSEMTRGVCCCAGLFWTIPY